MRERRYQDDLGEAGWNMDKPQIQGCVQVDPAWNYKGWRKMTVEERRVAGQ